MPPVVAIAQGPPLPSHSPSSASLVSVSDWMLDFLIVTCPIHPIFSLLLVAGCCIQSLYVVYAPVRSIRIQRPENMMHCPTRVFCPSAACSIQKEFVKNRCGWTSSSMKSMLYTSRPAIGWQTRIDSFYIEDERNLLYNTHVDTHPQCIVSNLRPPLLITINTKPKSVNHL